MGILDRNKSPAVLSKTSLRQSNCPNTPVNHAGANKQTTNAAHLKADGNKKATYSFLNNNNVEVSLGYFFL